MPTLQQLQLAHQDLEAGECSSRTSDASEDSSTEIVGVSEKGRDSSVSEYSVVDLESGSSDTNNKVVVHLLSKDETRDCRICHLSLDLSNEENEGENGIPIELGCSCKDDLAAAHKHCAEAWFKIKGNKTCEICGSIAQNVAGANEAELMEQWNEANDAMSVATAPGGTTTTTSDTRNFWQGHRFLNFLLACMVFAFVISWLFHFNVPS
ncbi:Zinc finger, RING-CH-type [Artemisia annua]|uniref:Zinc finger, RING-CH-type n=1 Tax=Artemisia annua TaxID=35608 RepID=A0A2U1KYP5_ARTAN|nr:Zinc finger, RING-CH-type [Artemisia annua]